MKKIIAIFLITIFLCANTSIGQLFKVPNLIEHFKEHQNEIGSKSISFVDFLKLHYSKTSENNQQEHQDLPFKTLDNVVSVFTFCFSQFHLEFTKPLIENKNKFFYKNSFKSKLTTSIWLPPKLV